MQSPFRAYIFLSLFESTAKPRQKTKQKENQESEEHKMITILPAQFILTFFSRSFCLPSPCESIPIHICKWTKFRTASSCSQLAVDVTNLFQFSKMYKQFTIHDHHCGVALCLTHTHSRIAQYNLLFKFVFEFAVRNSCVRSLT